MLSDKPPFWGSKLASCRDARSKWPQHACNFSASRSYVSCISSSSRTRKMPCSKGRTTPRCDLHDATQVWVGNGYLVKEDGMLKLLPTGGGSAMQCHGAYESEPRRAGRTLGSPAAKRRGPGTTTKKLQLKPSTAKASSPTVKGGYMTNLKQI